MPKSREGLDPSPEILTLPEPSHMEDYIAATCKDECNIIRQVRRAKQGCVVLKAHNPVKQTLMRAIACQCGLDSSQCHAETVTEVAKLDRLGFGNHGESNEATLFYASTLRRFGLPLDYARMEPNTLPDMCAC